MKHLALIALLAAPAFAQAPGALPAAPAAPAPEAGVPGGPWDPAARIAAQREAMKALDFLDGAWRGSAEAEAAGFVQTERVGSLLDGTVKLVEGRGWDDGKTVFNAFGIISYDPVERSYSMRSYAMGYAGDYPLAVRQDGFSWGHPMGPGVSLRYTATVKDGEWHEIGERIAGDAAPVRMFEMRLKRAGTTPWPREPAVPPL